MAGMPTVEKRRADIAFPTAGNSVAKFWTSNRSRDAMTDENF
jgi:hypothetical protein